ncbi:MAG: hypothetical protein QOG02_1890 [Gaiellales bacterium]|nr:hypothetical protein [Gaiellales bacterium]
MRAQRRARSAVASDEMTVGRERWRVARAALKPSACLSIRRDMESTDTFGMASVAHTAGHVLLIALLVIGVLCFAATSCRMLSVARGSSESW